MIERLVRAAERGVKLHVMARPPHTLKEDKLVEGVGGLRIIDDVGIKVHTLKHLKLHGKMFLADGTRCIVGSINLAPGSLDGRRELAIEARDPTSSSGSIRSPVRIGRTRTRWTSAMRGCWRIWKSAAKGRSPPMGPPCWPLTRSTRVEGRLWPFGQGRSVRASKRVRCSGANRSGRFEFISLNGAIVKLRILASAVATLAIAASVSTAAFAQAKPAMQHFLPDVKIDQCFITVPKAMSKKASGTQIVYENVGTHTYSSVTFAVGYRNSDSSYLRKVTDQGTFAPHAKIDHHFALYNDVTFGGKATTSCGAIAAQK